MLQNRPHPACSLQVAGAETVVMGLWKVNDHDWAPVIAVGRDAPLRTLAVRSAQTPEPALTSASKEVSAVKRHRQRGSWVDSRN